MGELKIKNKGKKEIYLTRNYNSLLPFDIMRDDVFFTLDANPFSDYLFQSTCSSWQNDKVKILSLPDKGRLFYITNPNAGNPIYANVVVDQIFLVRDILDNKILKFNAEGDFNNQFSGDYITEFKMERFCGNTSNNIISVIRLNMIDVQLLIKDKYNIFISQTCTNRGDSPTNYDVYCEGSDTFNLQSLLNTSSGFVRMTVDGGSSELGLSKEGGGALVMMENIPVNQNIIATLSAQGINATSAYPWGYPSQPVPVTYVFQYSLNGINNWVYFNLNIQNA